MSEPMTATNEAYAYILSEIRRGKYCPGDRLRAEEIASTIGISRIPVRESFGRLAAEGLLTIRPNRGVIVSALSADDVQEIFEIRAVLEGFAVRLAVPKVTSGDVVELEHLLQRMDNAADERDSQKFMSSHREFHHYLCALSDRPRAVQEIVSLHTALEPYMRLWFIYSEEPIGVHDDHQSILDAVTQGDSEYAGSVMTDHIATTSPDLMPYLT